MNLGNAKFDFAKYWRSSKTTVLKRFVQKT